MAKNEMKPGWEQTLMAEEIYRQAVARIIDKNGTNIASQDDTLEAVAETAIKAAIQWQKTQEKHKFPHLINTSGKDTV